MPTILTHLQQVYAVCVINCLLLPPYMQVFLSPVIKGFLAPSDKRFLLCCLSHTSEPLLCLTFHAAFDVMQGTTTCVAWEEYGATGTATVTFSEKRGHRTLLLEIWERQRSQSSSALFTN